MTEVATATLSTPPPPRTRNLALLAFIGLSLSVSMATTQEETPEIGSPLYWALVIGAALLPLLDVGAIYRTLFGRGLLLLGFALTAGSWHLLTGDLRVVLQLGLMVWVAAWLSSDNARLCVRDLLGVYLASVVVGVALWLLTDLNQWGLVPGTTAEHYGVWRVSYFSNIAMSAMLSLAVTMVLTRTMASARAHSLVLGLALYFLVFSFVRTALIALLLYVALRWWFARQDHPSPRSLFWTALLVGIGINLMIATTNVVLEHLQEFPVISRLFLRGETGLTPEEIREQAYRPWLWMQHLILFETSPFLMGLGVFEFSEVQPEALLVGTTPAGNEALLTRLLATYGLPALLFVLYLISRLRESARQCDLWACACFPPIILLVMQWGNFFHPTDAIGAIFFLMIVHGSKAFADDPSALPASEGPETDLDEAAAHPQPLGNEVDGAAQAKESEAGAQARTLAPGRNAAIHPVPGQS